MRDKVSAAVGYYTNGANFRNSAEQLEDQLEKDEAGRPKSPLVAIPYYVLVSHAAELFLKAALIKRGFTERELSRFEYGHDLLALLEELRKKGVQVSAMSSRTLAGLHQQHKEHTLRYAKFVGEKKMVYFPPFSEINSMLEELFKYTRISYNRAQNYPSHA